MRRETPIAVRNTARSTGRSAPASRAPAVRVAGWCPLAGSARSDDELFEALTAAVFEARFDPEIVRRRWPAIRDAFAGFSLRAVAGWTDAHAERLLAAPGIIRNRKKVRAALQNAHALAERAERHGSAWRYLDSFRPDLEALVLDIDAWAHYIGAPSIRWFVACAGVAERWRGAGRATAGRATAGRASDARPAPSRPARRAGRAARGRRTAC